MELKALYAEFNSLPLDTTPSRIRANRDRMRPYYEWALNNLGKYPGLHDFVDWFDFFDVGYMSESRIDDIPLKVKDNLAKIIAGEK